MHTGKPALGGESGDGLFVARIVRRERLGHAHRGDTGSTEPVERTPDVGHRQPIGHVEERAVHLEALARSDLDVAQGRPLLDPLEVGATAHPDDAHRRRVTLDQRVHRLRGGVRDEIDVVRPDLFGEFRDGLHHTSGDPTRRPCASSAPPRWRRSIDP